MLWPRRIKNFLKYLFTVHKEGERRIFIYSFLLNKNMLIARRIFIIIIYCYKNHTFPLFIKRYPFIGSIISFAKAVVAQIIIDKLLDKVKILCLAVASLN
jgi:hypothetical protein